MWTNLAFGNTVLPDSFSRRLPTTGLSHAALDCTRQLFALVWKKKTFDMVKHQQFLFALAAVGISGAALAWFRSYFRGRQQRVVTHTGTCPLVPIASGMPQGTILGPVLFNIYVRKLPLTAEAFSFKLPMFADDMTLYASRLTPVEAL